MYDYSWVEFDFHGLFHFVVETTVDISGAEHLVVAWFISFLLSFFFSFFLYYSCHNVLTDLDFHDKPMKLGNDEIIYEPGTVLSQTRWSQEQDFGLVLLAIDPNSEYYWTRGSIFC